MGNPQELTYQQFEGVCRKCGKEFTYHNSVRRHPNYLECPECEEVTIVETLTGQKSFSGAVKGWG